MATVTENLFPELDTASVAALEALNKELTLTSATRYVTLAKPARLVLDLQCEGNGLHGLIDTGSEINMISDAAVTSARLPKHRLSFPKTVLLAMQEGESTPIILTHCVNVTLKDSLSDLTFPDFELRVGSISGSHDMILGIPFLSSFSLTVSIPTQSI